MVKKKAIQKYRWIWVGLGAWAILWLGIVGLRTLYLDTQETYSSVPLPQKPEIEEIKEKDPETKLSQYREEIKEKNKPTFDLPPREREERIQMAWDEVYKGDRGEVEGKINEPVKAEKTTKAPSYSSGSYTKKSEERSPTEKELDSKEEIPPAGFHTQVLSKKKSGPGSVKAEIFGAQELQSGEAVKIKLKEPLEIGRERLPAGSLILGTCQKGQRLFIDIKQLSLGGRLKQVNIDCMDASDLQKGLMIQEREPDEISQGLAESTADEIINTLPAGSGILRNGKDMIKKVIRGKNRNSILLPHGYELILKIKP